MTTWNKQVPSIPRLWEREKQWQEAADHATGAVERLLRIQRELAIRLKDADGVSPSPALAAWISLWSRAFQLAGGAIACAEGPNLLVIRILERAALEAALQIMAIVTALEPGDVRVDGDLKKTQARSRLEAYTAFSLYNDLKYWQEMRGQLKDIFDPRPARDHVRARGPMRSFFERMGGEIEVQSDYEAEQEREAAREVCSRKIASLTALLDDDRLKPWVETLSGEKSPYSFFGLLDADNDSIRRTLAELGVPNAAATYGLKSGAVHGSSLHEGIFQSGTVFGPLIGGHDRDLEEALEGVARDCLQVAVGLYLLRPEALGYA